MKNIAIISILTLLAFSMTFCGGESKDQPETSDMEQTEDQPAADQMQEESMDQEATDDDMDEEAEDDDKGETEKKDMPQKATTDFTTSPLVGQVKSLAKMVRGGNGDVTAAEAKEMSASVMPLVVVSGGKTYFVYSGGGSYYGKIIAKKAGSEIKIWGKVKKVDNLNVIIASKVE